MERTMPRIPVAPDPPAAPAPPPSRVSAAGRGLVVECAAASDATLARRAAAGDRDAFAELVARHEGTVLRVAWRILGCRDDAEDAAQEAFVRAWRSLAGYDPARGDFRPWLLRITHNAALTALSRGRGPVPVDLDGAFGADIADPRAGSPAESAARREALARVARAVAELPPDCAGVFQMRYGEEMPLEEIARVTGQRPGTVAVMLHRLRDRVRHLVTGTKGERP